MSEGSILKTGLKTGNGLEGMGTILYSHLLEQQLQIFQIQQWFQSIMEQDFLWKKSGDKYTLAGASFVIVS